MCLTSLLYILPLSFFSFLFCIFSFFFLFIHCFLLCCFFPSGCILAELYTGYPLFPGENEVEQLACLMEVLGPPPDDIIATATRKRLFFGKHKLLLRAKLPAISKTIVLLEFSIFYFYSRFQRKPPLHNQHKGPQTQAWFQEHCHSLKMQ